MGLSHQLSEDRPFYPSYQVVVVGLASVVSVWVVSGLASVVSDRVVSDQVMDWAASVEDRECGARTGDCPVHSSRRASLDF